MAESTGELCGERGLIFVPLFIEARGGGFGNMLRQVLGHLAIGIANRWNKNPNAIARRTAQRISFLTHTENAQAVMKRLHVDFALGAETLIL